MNLSYEEKEITQWALAAASDEAYKLDGRGDTPSVCGLFECGEWDKIRATIHTLRRRIAADKESLK